MCRNETWSRHCGEFTNRWLFSQPGVPAIPECFRRMWHHPYRDPQPLATYLCRGRAPLESTEA